MPKCQAATIKIQILAGAVYARGKFGEKEKRTRKCCCALAAQEKCHSQSS